MSPKQRERAIAAIKAHIGLDEETRKLITLANTDLYYGPINMPFDSVCRRLSEALSNVSELWLNLDCDYCQDTEPTWLCDGRCGYDEDGGCENHDDGEDPMQWAHYERPDVIRALVGAELSRYVS